jgi:hypothetical protein
MAAICSVMAGCAATKTVTVRTDPLGAAVYLDGLQSGITPFTTELKFKPATKTFEVTAKKEGFRDGTTVIQYEPKSQTQYDITLERISKTGNRAVSPH